MHNFSSFFLHDGIKTLEKFLIVCTEIMTLRHFFRNTMDKLIPHQNSYLENNYYLHF